MPKITATMLRGKTKAQVQQLVLAASNSGNLTQDEFNKASKCLAKLNGNAVLTDAQVRDILDDLF